MKSKRAEKLIDNSSELIDGQEWMVDASTARQAVELAEQDADERYHDDLCHYQLMMNDTCSHMIDERDEEITRYRTKLEESKKREELARKVIDDQRKEMEEVKARAVEAHRDCCRNFTKQCKCWDMDRGFDTPHTCNLQCSYMENFIQKLNEK